MLRDGQIVYGAHESPLFYREFENPAVNGIVIALLTTILSYQVASSLFDIVLGFKAKDRAKASDMHILLLTQQSSPLAVVNSLVRNDWITRRHFRGDIPRGSDIVREQRRVRFAMCTKLLFLLAVAPVVNIMAIALTLERERTFSFSELKFGGLALGVNTDLSIVDSEAIAPDCSRSHLQTVSGEQPYPLFSTCAVWSTENFRDVEGIVGVSFVVSSELHILSMVIFGNTTSMQLKSGYVVTGGELYYTKHDITYGSIARLANVGMRLLFDELGIEDAEVTEMLAGSEGSFGNDSLTLTRFTRYSPPDTSPEIVRRIHSRLGDHITFVNSDSLKLKNILELSEITQIVLPQNYTSADELPLLTRRRRNLSLPLLGTVTLCAVVVRVIVKVLFHNDLSRGLEEVIKVQTRIERNDSLFQGGKRKLYYNKKYQEGNYAQYGLIRDDMPEVDEFVGGSIGLESDPVELE